MIASKLGLTTVHPHVCGEYPTNGHGYWSAGGETLGAIDKIKMQVPEVELEGTLVRYFEGTDLYNFTDAERIVLKKQVAQHWMVRMLVGDYDGHAFNMKVGPDGRLAGIDFNLADILDEGGKGFAFSLVLNKPGGVSSDPAQMAADMEALMRYSTGWTACAARSAVTTLSISVWHRSPTRWFSRTLSRAWRCCTRGTARPSER